MKLTQNQLRALAGMPTINEHADSQQARKQLVESDEYEGSIDFTHDLETVAENIKSLGNLIKADKFKKWCKSTDYNFGTDTADQLLELVEAFDALETAFEKFEDDMQNAG